MHSLRPTSSPAASSWSIGPGQSKTLPRQMRAVAFSHFGGPEVLHQIEVDTPRVGPTDVAVRVAAVSLGRLLDVSARAGTHPYVRFTLPHILGAEHAGIVAAVGSDVASVRQGDRVAVFPVVSCGDCVACDSGVSEACPRTQIMGVHTPGSYAEYTVVPEANVFAVPAEVTLVDAAALALSGAVAQNQFDEAGLTAGEWLLIQGASSALGSLTMALALHRGARVIAASRSTEKRARLAELGAEVVLDPFDPRFLELVMHATGGAGVNLAVDNLGHAELWHTTMNALSVRGRVVTSGAFLGERVEISVLSLYYGNRRILGVRSGNLRSAARLWSAVNEGLRPPVDCVFPIAQASEAHRYLEAGTNVGRVLLTTADQDWTSVRSV
jgi:NADPH:quinone reductase-like Zn-dependent oxidoreductase